MPASGITGTNLFTPERYIGAPMIMDMAQPLPEKPVPLLLFVGLVHGRIRVLVARLNTPERGHLGDLCQTRIVIKTHSQRRSRQQCVQGVLLQAHLDGVGATFQHPQIQLPPPPVFELPRF